MHMHAHAALTLFLFISVFFFLQSFFFLILPFSKTNFRYAIYHLFESNKNPVVVPDLGPFWLGKNHQMTQITSRNHTAWGPIRRVGLLVNTAYPMQSVKTRMR